MKTTRPVGGFKGLLKSVNGDGPSGWALGGSLALILLLQLGGSATLQALRYDEKAALAAGQWWRLASAHLVPHWTCAMHVLNGLRPRARRGLSLYATIARANGSSVLGSPQPRPSMRVCGFCDTGVLWYVGASGVLHGVMAAGILAELRRGEWTGLVLAVLLVAKLAYEHWSERLARSPAAAVPVVVNAHLYGVLGGLAAALWMKPQPLRL